MRGAALASLIWLAAAAVAAAPAPAAAEAPARGRLETAPLLLGTYHAQVAKLLYLNRCRGGCTITKAGLSDARTHLSAIPNGPSGQVFTLTEYAWGDAEWDRFMTCMREVYSPFGVTITDAKPADGVAYNENIVAGLGSELGLSGVGGIAPVAGDCSPYSYIISFSFANGYGPNSVLDVCWTAAQETAHSFGIEDHAYAFLDGSSACRDPMTYRADCGGQKFFRNEVAVCGEFSPRSCKCSSPNSHLKLLSVLGPGMPLTPPPAVAITSPAADTELAAGAAVLATASAQRGVKVLELWLNGYKWGEKKGAAFGPNGQPEAGYALPIPADVPGGIIDIVVMAKDDIDATTATPPITVRKGPPCTSADTCAAGQRCDAGRCRWDPPAGELGDPCAYPQYCKSGVCQGTADEQLCTQTCIAGVADSCPPDYSCLPTSQTLGICWPGALEDPGCCSSSNDAAVQAALGALGLLVVLRRRRRR
jgi:MYXO-CTERM domain-containing protein